jgi:hypothetical protein
MGFKLRAPGPIAEIYEGEWKGKCNKGKWTRKDGVRRPKGTMQFLKTAKRMGTDSQRYVGALLKIKRSYAQDPSKMDYIKHSAQRPPPV